jgi:hypothetical protein
MDDVERKFESAMRVLHTEAKALGYNATRFIQLVEELGGVAAAKKLVTAPAPTEGFTKLWELRRLDLSVEAFVLRPEFRTLFTPEERRAAKHRLEEYGWTPTPSGPRRLGLESSR